MNKALLDNHRYINVDHDDWYEYVHNQFIERMRDEVGIEVDKIYFSGFWSQGDGACFIGELSDVPRLMAHYNLTPEYPMITKLLEMGGRAQCRIYHRGRYYHDDSVAFNWDIDVFTDCVALSSLFIELVVERFDILLDPEKDRFMAEVESCLKAEMRQLYKDLEREYDSLTTDEAVWEAIVANELHLEEIE
jgi:hypothetical protein